MSELTKSFSSTVRVRCGDGKGFKSALAAEIIAMIGKGDMKSAEAAARVGGADLIVLFAAIHHLNLASEVLADLGVNVTLEAPNNGN